MAWTVEFFEEEITRRAPVEEFLSSLPQKHKAKALAIVKLLEEQGPDLAFPYSSHVRGKVFELRTRLGRDRIRILYFGDSRRWLILLHALIKRSDKLDERDIHIAEARIALHNARLGKRKGGEKQ